MDVKHLNQTELSPPLAHQPAHPRALALGEAGTGLPENRHPCRIPN